MESWPEWTASWGKVMGVQVDFKQISRDEFFAGVPEPVVREIGDAWDYAEEFGHAGGNPDILLPEQVSL